MRFPQKSGPVFQINTTIRVFLLPPLLGVSVWQFKSIPQLNKCVYVVKLCRPFSHQLIWLLSPVSTRLEITVIYLNENSKLKVDLMEREERSSAYYWLHQGAQILSLYANAWFYKWFECLKCFRGLRRDSVSATSCVNGKVNFWLLLKTPSASTHNV